MPHSKQIRQNQLKYYHMDANFHAYLSFFKFSQDPSLWARAAARNLYNSNC